MKKDSSYSCIGARSRGAVWAALALSAGLVMTPTIVFADELGGRSLSDPTVVTALSGQAQDPAGLESGQQISAASGTDVASANTTPTQQTGAGQPEETKQPSQEQNLSSASSEMGASEGVEHEASSEDLQNAQPLSSENASTNDSSPVEPAQPTHGKDGAASDANAVTSGGLSDANGQEGATTPAASEATTAVQSTESVVSASTEEQSAIYVSAQGDDSADGKSVDTAYRTLQQAINACPDGGTVYIVGTYQTPDKQLVSITKNMTLAGYEQNGAKAELHEGKGVQYYLNIGNGLNVNIKDLVIDGENPDDRPGMGHGRLIMVTLERGRTRYTTLTLDNTEVRNYIGHALINDDNGVAKLIIKDSSIHGYKGSFRSMSSAIMGFSYIEATNSKFYDCNGSYVWPVSGGAIRLYEGQTGVFTNCEFYNNSQHLGGAIYNAGTLTLNDCNFRNNHAIGSNADGWQDNGGAIYNAGTATINGGSITDNDARSNGGGVYNRDGSAVMTLNGVTIYNNTAGDSGDDIFNRKGGTITFEAVGKDWKLDGHPCKDNIDAWYDDSADTRWNAHDVPSVHVKKVQAGKYEGDALAIKAAHDTGGYKVSYRLQNPDGTYGEAVELPDITLCLLGDSSVQFDHSALDAELAEKGYRLASMSPSALKVTRSFGDDGSGVYSVVLAYDLKKDPTPDEPDTPEEQTYTITYDPAGGVWSDGSAGVISKTYSKTGDPAKILDAPTREGYEFVYWEGSLYQPGDTYNTRDEDGLLTDDTLTAVWKKALDVNPSETDKPDAPSNASESEKVDQPGITSVVDQHATPVSSEKAASVSAPHKSLPATGDTTSAVLTVVVGVLGLGLAALGSLLRRRRED